MADIRWEDLLTCAVDAAKAAGEHARDQQHRRRETHAREAHDVKLALDLESQQRAASVIHRCFPEHSILGEEESHDRDASRPLWIVDPIDGTVNFSHGLPLWCSSVAVEYQGQTLAGAIYAPMFDELYVAAEKHPAQMNGRDLHVSDIATLAESLVLTDTNKEPHDFPAGAALYEKCLFHAQKARVMGTAAYDLCRIASGMAEGYTALGIYPWDAAAAALMVEKAGGRFEVIERLPSRRFRAVCSNGLIHDELKALFLETVAEYCPPQ